MNLGKLGLFAAGAVASLAIVCAAACTTSTTGTVSDGGSSSGSSGSSSGSSGSSGEAGGECFPASGMYTYTYTADSSNSSATCESAMSLDGTASVDEKADLAPDAGESVTGCGGTFAGEAMGCTTTETCTENVDGGVTQTTTIVTTVAANDGTSISGTLTKVTMSGGVDETCKYTFTAKKQ